MVKKHGDEMQKEGNETLPLPIFGLENSLLSNALKACVNGIDNSQEKDKKIWRGIEKDNLENSVLV